MAKVQAEIIYENTVSGIFLKRNSRFSAQVMVDGREETAHIKNTGRLGELLMSKAKITLQRVESENRTTPYDLISVYKPKLKWVNIDSLAPNKLAEKWIKGIEYDLVKPEYSFGGSRIDFYMERGEERYLTEVKGCTLADPQRKGVGLFPDAPTERGVKHLKELIKASEQGYHCMILFVIQMNGVHLVFPNTQTHPEFGETLVQAADAGVEISYLSCHVDADRIKVTGIVGDTARYRKS